MLKSTVTQKTENDGYPKIMIATDGDVVLFHSPFRGVIISSPKNHDVGYHSEDWCMESFKDFIGRVTIEQN